MNNLSCIKQCKLLNGTCTGCTRTIEEIKEAGKEYYTGNFTIEGDKFIPLNNTNNCLSKENWLYIELHRG